MADGHKVRSIRFSTEDWELVGKHASKAGVSAAQFVRDSTMLRIAWRAARETLSSNGSDPELDTPTIAKEVRRRFT